MNFETEVKSLVKQAVMQEINDLGIRATIRERITETGLTKDDINNMVKDTVDSYIKSALNSQNVESTILHMFNTAIEETVKREIQIVIKGYTFGWGGERKIKEALDNAIRAEVNRGFKVKVDITPKGE
jgi:tetrahydromethanopterin S-methyltransferase subunit H